MHVTSSPNPVGYLDAQHYGNVRDVGLKLLQQYSPENHFFVAVGRAPVAIATFLRELNPDIAMTFPASDMRREIKPEWKQAYFQHFVELIPKDVQVGSRTIVLFDRSRKKSGVSLARLKEFLEEYLRSIGSNVKVRAVGLAPAGPLVAGVEHMSTADYPRAFLYQRRAYDHDEGVAPFLHKHRIGVTPLESLQENPNFEPFSQALHERMEHDRELDQLLTQNFGHLVDGEK